MDLASLEIKIARSENLPVLPQIVGQVLKLADDPNASANAMEKVIERDAAITAKLLRVASSSFYGVSNVPTISRAISVLGMNAIRTLVVGIAYQQMISGKPHAQLFSKSDFWKHSLATGTAARVLGKIRAPGKAEELFCAGMLHDIGLLILDRFAPSELDEAIKMARDEGIPLHEAERQLYGYDHAKVGLILADRWGMPPSLKAAIGYHHDWAEAEGEESMTAFVAVANDLAKQCGFRAGSPEIDEGINEGAMDMINVPLEQLEIIKPVLIQDIQRAQEAYHIEG
jgi:HD-like signal output (HDOD) protein